jgi:hypothetical protein
MKNRVSKLHGLPTAIRLVPRPIRWEIAVTSAMQPQEAQQLFPDWPALRDDLLVTNQRLISYVGALETMIGRPSAPGTWPVGLKPKRTATGDRGSVSGN